VTRLSFMLLLTILVSSCTKDNGIVLLKGVADAVSDRVVRTDTSTWVAFTCTPGAISFEAPKNARIGCTSESGVTIGMHEIRPPLGIVDDITYGLYFTMQRTPTRNSADAERMQRRSHSATTADWMSAHHAVLAKIVDGEYVYYRYDPQCQSGGDIRIAARLWTRVTKNSLALLTDDDRIIRRIISSVHCLG